MKFAVSTVALSGVSLAAAIDAARSQGFALEFSSGIASSPDLVEVFLRADCLRLPHNYFPPPADPFVLNLASLNPAVVARSLAHCEQGLRLAASVRAPFYSVHAGFCGDPQPDQLGRPLGLATRSDRSAHWQVFIERVRVLARLASGLGVGLAIENNVLAAFNLASDGTHGLLCVEESEMRQLLAEVGDDTVGLLLDTGHWKVSAATLGTPLEFPLKDLESRVWCLHHSDNDGTADSNGPITPAYWFLNELDRFCHSWHVLEVREQSLAAIAVQRHLLSRGGLAVND